MSKFIEALLARTRALSGKRRWPAVPQPTQSPASLQQAVIALKLRSEVQSRETGDILDSYVSVRDLIQLGVLTSQGNLKTSYDPADPALDEASGALTRTEFEALKTLLRTPPP